MCESRFGTWQLLELCGVTFRQRPKGETNGKSGNLNNAISQIYPEGIPIPGNEVLAIFDADQVPSACRTHNLSPANSSIFHALGILCFAVGTPLILVMRMPCHIEPSSDRRTPP